MSRKKNFGLLAAVALALCAAGDPSASAAHFTFSATGSLEGKAVENQVFTLNGGTVKCATAAGAGVIGSTDFTTLHLRVKYSGCTAFGFSTIDFSEATYQFTAGEGKDVHIKNTMTLTPTLFGASLCTVTVGPQTVGTVDYSNASASTVKVAPAVTGIKYTSSGGSCGTSGENGTYTGASEVSRVGGGSVQYDK
jgi:hypothetical protein